MTILESLLRVDPTEDGRIEFLFGDDSSHWPKLRCREANVLALGEANLMLDAGRSIQSPGDLNIAATGKLTVAGRDIVADGQSLNAHLAAGDNPHAVTAAQIGALALSGGTLTGALTVQGDLTTTGTSTINGRNIAADGSKLDAHVAARNNPHAVTAVQVGALALGGGTLTGALTVQGDLTTTGTGTINGRNIAADGAKLDAHLAARDNPHGVTATQVGALALDGGAINGSLRVEDALVANKGLKVGSKQVIDHEGKWVGETGILSGHLPASSGVLVFSVGSVTLDSSGTAAVDLPEEIPFIQALVGFQLTAIGAPAPYLHVLLPQQDEFPPSPPSRKFKIAGGFPGLEVSWLVSWVGRDSLIWPRRTIELPETP